MNTFNITALSGFFAAASWNLTQPVNLQGLCALAVSILGVAYVLYKNREQSTVEVPND